MSREAPSSLKHEQDTSTDMIDLPPVLIDMVYHYDPSSAVGLDPRRQAVIIREITGSSIHRQQADLVRILQALGSSDYDTLADYPELFSYIRSIMEADRPLWITTLLRKPTMAAFTELMRLNVLQPIVDENSQDYITGRYAKLVAVEGDIDTVRALGLFNYMSNGDTEITEIDWSLYHTRSRAVAKEAAAIVLASNWRLETIFQDFATESDDEKEFLEGRSLSQQEWLDTVPIFQETIDSIIAADSSTALDRLNQMMKYSIEYGRVSVTRLLNERYDIKIPTFVSQHPLDLIRRFIETNEEVHIERSEIRNEIWERIAQYKNEVLEIVLPLFPSWPVDFRGDELAREIHDRSYTSRQFDPKEIRYQYTLRSDFFSILIYGKTPLLNRFSPELFNKLFETLKPDNRIALLDPQSGFHQKVVKYLDSDKRLSSTMRITILRALRCEATHPWIVKKD